MNNKYAIISPKIEAITNKLKEIGYELIYTDCVDEFISYEKHHADMQCFNFDNRIIVLKNCENLYNTLRAYGFNVIKTTQIACGEYPDNIKLNTITFDKTMIGNIQHIDESLIELAKSKNYKFINVKQGYTKCSSCKISENAVITSDKSIYNSLKDIIDVLIINEGHIKLYDSKRGGPTKNSSFFKSVSFIP